MIGLPSRHSSSSNAPDYRRAFLDHAHQLLQLGFERLNHAALAEEEEPAITGELVRGISEVLDDPEQGDWTAFFSVHDDPPVNQVNRKGKRRKRVDIRLDSSQQRPRSHFSWEAKRLGSKYPIKDYLGEAGLGCFLSGEYAAGDPDAGMLGYVQAETPEVWAKRLEAALSSKASTDVSLLDDGKWAPHAFKQGPRHSFRTRHARTAIGRSIEVYHTLLCCC